MFEDKTYQFILTEMLGNVPSTVDKREGSIIYDALAPAAYELAKMYLELGNILNEAFADTAGRVYLVKRATERGLTPYAATYATVLAKLSTEVDIGTRFSGGLYNYVVTELEETDEDGYYYYRLQCETAGSTANSYTGALTPIEDVQGLILAQIEDVIIPGRDEEDTETFRKRYFDSFENQAFGGNIAYYKEYVKELDGVGGVKVYPVWHGGGTVMLRITNAEFNIPSKELLEDVQKRVDPVPQGTGVGIAPIGHRVTVLGAEAGMIDIALYGLVFKDGYTWEAMEQTIRSAVEEYFDELNSEWGDSEIITLRMAEIETRVFKITGVEDISSVRFSKNGEVVDGNAVLYDSEIAVLGEVSMDESS